MSQFCAVISCGSNSTRDKGVSFFKFPSVLDCSRKINKKKQLRRLCWIQALKRTDLTESKLKNERVCSKHFITGTPAKLQDENNPDWIPSISMGHVTSASTNAAPSTVTMMFLHGVTDKPTVQETITN